jgi:phosphatidylglycerophosphate synthase
MNGKINNHFKIFMNDTKTMFKEFSHKKTRQKQVANMLSFYRLISPIPTIIFASIALITKSLILMIIGMMFAITGAISDAIDGKYARKHNTTSEYGKKLDQYCDKVFAGSFALFLSILNHLFIIVTALELSIALVNYYYFKHYNLNQDSLMIGKVKQTPLFISLGLGFLNALISNINLITNIMITITIIFQIFTMLTYIINYKSQLKLINNNN